MLTALLVITCLALVLGVLLKFDIPRFKTETEPLVVRIDAILPQTQCRQCGYQGCKPYAAAIASGEADINQCPPGGDAGVRRLADLLGREYKPLNTAHGVHKPKSIAVIDEDVCIGCTLCLQACPVDAILGSAKHMHTVIAAECTGCELCIAPCPVDCISMEPIVISADNGKGRYPLFEIPLVQYYRNVRNEAIAKERERTAANVARERYEFRLMRIDREKQERVQHYAKKTAGPGAGVSDAAKKAAIAAAMERAKAQKAAVVPANTDNLPPSVRAQIAEIDARRSEAAAATENKVLKRML